MEKRIEKDKKREEVVVENKEKNNLEETKENVKKVPKKDKKEKNSKFKKSKEKVKKQEKDMKKMGGKKDKKKYAIIGISLGCLLIIALFISTIFALVNINNENIISGVSISGIDVSGLSQEEAKGKLEVIYNEKKDKDINLKHNDFETTLSPELMEVNYKIDEAVENAVSIGKSKNIFKNNYDILCTLIEKRNIPVEMTLNEDATKQTIEDMNASLSDVLIDSGYSIEDDELIITKGKAGVKIDTDNLLNQVKQKLNDINEKDDFIEIPVINKEPEAIDIDKIHSEVYKEPQNAYYTKDPFTVYPEVEGVDFDIDAAKELLKQDKEEYVIKLKITEPEITLENIGTEAFPDQLSTFTTRYDVSDVDRSTNLRLASEKINGKVLAPGETFSYNKTVGARTIEAGYKNAKVYESGKVVDGIGGGICQVSSTLYNAALLANLEIVERRNHQFVTSYVEAGRDATVVYGQTDFKFKNTRKYPIRIVVTTNAGILKISIFGIKEENEYTFKFNTKTVSSIPYKTQYIEDSSLAERTEKVEQKGANGLITETYITKMLNGKVVSTELLSKDTYSAMTRIIRRGTKKTSSSSNSGNTTTTTQNANTQETTTQPIQENVQESQDTQTVEKTEDTENVVE